MVSPGMSANTAPKTVVTRLRIPKGRLRTRIQHWRIAWNVWLPRDLSRPLQKPQDNYGLESSTLEPSRRALCCCPRRRRRRWVFFLCRLRMLLLVSQPSFPLFLRCCDCAIRVLVGVDLVGGFLWTCDCVMGLCFWAFYSRLSIAKYRGRRTGSSTVGFLFCVCLLL